MYLANNKQQLGLVSIYTILNIKDIIHLCWFKRREGKGRILMEGKGEEGRGKNSLVWFNTRRAKITFTFPSLPSPCLVSKERDFNSNMIYYYILLNMIVKFNEGGEIFRIKKNK